LRLELNLKDLQVDTCLFSAIEVLPTGPWISDFYKGTRSLGRRSFCTIVRIDLHVETELSNTDQRVIILIGPLPKGSLPAQTVHSGARMAELRHNINEVCRAELQTKGVLLVGRFDKDSSPIITSPMFIYMEFDSAHAAQFFGSVVDQHVPPEFSKLMISLGGKQASQMQIWSCNLIAECLSAADEKILKALMAHGQARPCPLPPPAFPFPPAPGHKAGPWDEREGRSKRMEGRPQQAARITLRTASMDCSTQLMRREDLESSDDR
jgi:hypothetical protein